MTEPAAKRTSKRLKLLAVAAVLIGAIALAWPTFSLWVRQKGLEAFALNLCDTFDHQSGADCRQEVEVLAADCARQVLAENLEFDDHLACLGFEPVEWPDPVVVGGCERPHIIWRISASFAMKEPWPGSAHRVVDGEPYYVAQVPSFSTEDILALRLEEADGSRYLELEIERAAARRLREVIGKHAGEWMVTSLNDAEEVNVIFPSRSSGRGFFSPPLEDSIQFHAQGLRLEDLCDPAR